jgi:hypothetical protein
MLWVARRLSRRAFDVFLFGTAMSGGSLADGGGPKVGTARIRAGLRALPMTDL